MTNLGQSMWLACRFLRATHAWNPLGNDTFTQFETIGLAHVEVLSDSRVFAIFLSNTST